MYHYGIPSSFATTEDVYLYEETLSELSTKAVSCFHPNGNMDHRMALDTCLKQYKQSQRPRSYTAVYDS